MLIAIAHKYHTPMPDIPDLIFSRDTKDKIISLVTNYILRSRGEEIFDRAGVVINEASFNYLKKQLKNHDL